jgi:DUF1680 family protein
LERGYYVVSRSWRDDDEIALELPMPVERMMAHPMVKADANRVALQRGPLVYCLEAVDHRIALDRLVLPIEQKLTVHDLELFGNIKVIRGVGLVQEPVDWARRLYQPQPAPQQVPIAAVPYYLWDNRAAGAMRVWLPLSPEPAVPDAVEQETKANHTTSEVAPREGRRPTSL